MLTLVVDMSTDKITFCLNWYAIGPVQVNMVEEYRC